MPRSTLHAVCAAATLATSLLFGGCVSTTVIKANSDPALKATREVPEPELLDVGIAIFDEGLPTTDEEREKLESQLVFVDVRKAEARYFPYALKQTLEDTGHWGAVRVIPRASNSVDLAVVGRIVSSDGERLVLSILATDAVGRVWVDKEYEDLAAKLSYRDSLAHGQDPFTDIYIAIANDLTLMAGSLSGEELRRIRSVAELRFAEALAPQIFDGYLATDDAGLTQAQRLPAADDPNVERMRRVREREYMFFDTLDGHYAGFHEDMTKPYDEWRKYSYDEVVALRDMQHHEALLHKVMGAAVIAGGLMIDNDSTAGSAGQAAAIYGGMMAVKTGMDMTSQARAHSEALRELGDSFEGEVAPLVLDIEGVTVALSGSLDEQFDDWRRLLREIYVAETGAVITNEPSPAPPSTTEN